MAGEGKKVVVIGAGIVGVSTAIWLQRDGHAVTLADRTGIGEATSHGNGGVLASAAIVPVTGPGLIAKAPFMLLDPRAPLFLKWRYLPRLAPWLLDYLKHCNEADTRRIATALNTLIGDSVAEHRMLAAGTGAERYLHPCDYLYVYKDRTAFEKDSLGWAIRAAHGFKWRELEGDRLRAVLPQLSAMQKFAVALADHGRISDPGGYVKALAADFLAKGGKFIKGALEDVVLKDGALRSVRIDGRETTCDAVVLATGAWSQSLLRKLGFKRFMESERGYHLELLEPSAMPSEPMMIAAGKFVVTPMDGRLRLAGIVEFGGLDAPPSAAPFRLLERAFRNIFPSITWKETRRWMGHRPATSDSLPLIGEIKGAKGCFTGLGHHHIGLTGGPKTGRLLAQLVGAKKPNLDLAPFAPMRFQSTS